MINNFSRSEQVRYNFKCCFGDSNSLPYSSSDFASDVINLPRYSYFSTCLIFIPSISFTIQGLNIAFPVPFFGMLPNCSSDISHFVLPLIHCNRIFSNTFVMWLIKLSMQQSSHFLVPAFFGKVLKTDQGHICWKLSVILNLVGKLSHPFCN